MSKQQLRCVALSILMELKLPDVLLSVTVSHLLLTDPITTVP